MGCRSGLGKNDAMLGSEHGQAGYDDKQHARWPEKVGHGRRNGISSCGNGKRPSPSSVPAHEKGSKTRYEELGDDLVPQATASFAQLRLLMLWTAPPPAHRCHGCGRC